MLVGTDGCVCVGGNRSPRKKPPARLDDHINISHATPGIDPWVVAVRGQRFTIAPVGQPVILQWNVPLCKDYNSSR